MGGTNLGQLGWKDNEGRLDRVLRAMFGFVCLEEDGQSEDVQNMEMNQQH